MNVLLLDTGPIVASLDRADPYHEWVTARFNSFRGRVLTTGPIITEAMFFLQDVRDGPQGLVALIEALSPEIWDCFKLEALRSAARLMTAYAETPMDFADATLVLAAECYGARDIATLDERGFRTFHNGRNKSFRLVLQDSTV